MRPMRRAGARRSVAGLCIAVVLVAALLPGFAVLDYAIPEPGWVLLPDLSIRSVPGPSRACAPTIAAVVPPLPSRAPPARFRHS